jgi:hypothetical protein
LCASGRLLSCLSAAGRGDHAPEPSLGDGHHVHPNGARLRLPRRRDGLGQSPRAVVARIEARPVGELLQLDLPEPDTRSTRAVGITSDPAQFAVASIRPKGDPRRVKVHDFEDKKLGKVVSYGVYDVGADAGR